MTPASLTCSMCRLWRLQYSYKAMLTPPAAFLHFCSYLKCCIKHERAVSHCKHNPLECRQCLHLRGCCEAAGHKLCFHHIARDMFVAHTYVCWLLHRAL